ncbi:OmpH family outer membrane protein [uncultured Megasphaera sp.]|uniref:OmpH family outer membrane protein n=1 Tax=uncultured Megasphaera sp. TaxID=165188 RepID=UPI002658E6EF|nr:OmpH family outer membrane protein [uncultured Megasphaera sp.]
MMAEMGKKRNIKIFSGVIALIFVLSIAGLAVMQMGNPVNAAPSSNIGVVDMSKVITPDNQDAVDMQKQLQQAGEDMQKQFEEQSANMTDEQKQELFQKMQGDMAKKRDEIFKGLQDKINTAVGNVANTKGLSLVVDKRAVLYGGTDITDQVTKELNNSQSK